MKKIFGALVILCLIASEKSNAQLQRGNVLVGGDIADFDLGLNKNSHTYITVDPKAAWFIQNNVAVGAYVDLGLDIVKGYTDTKYGVGALGRYYFGPGQVNTETVMRHTRLFAEGNVGIQGENVTHGSTTNGLGLGIGPGIAYFITPNISFETLLKYNAIVGFGNDPLNSRLKLNFGFQIYLPGRATANKVQSDTK